MKAVKLYAPLHLVLFAMSKRRSVSSFFMNLSRSAVFLTAYCAMALCSGCVIYRFIPRSRLTLISHTWLAGLPILFERQGRRVELAAYVTTYALDSLYRMTVKRGMVRSGGHPIIGRLTLIVCSGLLLHHAGQLPPLISQWLLGVSTGEYSDEGAPSSPRERSRGRSPRAPTQEPQEDA